MPICCRCTIIPSYAIRARAGAAAVAIPEDRIDHRFRTETDLEGRPWKPLSGSWREKKRELGVPRVLSAYAGMKAAYPLPDSINTGELFQLRRSRARRAHPAPSGAGSAHRDRQADTLPPDDPNEEARWRTVRRSNKNAVVITRGHGKGTVQGDFERTAYNTTAPVRCSDANDSLHQHHCTHNGLVLRLQPVNI